MSVFKFVFKKIVIQWPCVWGYKKGKGRWVNISILSAEATGKEEKNPTHKLKKYIKKIRKERAWTQPKSAPPTDK